MSAAATGRAASGARGRRRTATGLAAAVSLVGTLVHGAVSDITVTDVSTRAFAVVWASDEAVTGASVRVFQDAGGTAEITGSFERRLVSAAFPPALERGVVKVDVTGLVPDTTVFVQTVTTGAGGTVQAPSGPPFIAVRTAVGTTKVNAANQLIVNDLIVQDVVAPDGVSPVDGTLLVVDAPGRAAHPISAFVGEGFASPAAVVDLSNLFDATTRTSLEVASGTTLTLSEFRGLTCPMLVDHRQLHFRRAPEHSEIGATGVALTQLETAAACFFADTVCDDAVNVLDVQRVLNTFNRASGVCAFNPDLDLVADDVINVLDVQSVLNRFGETAPFTP